MNQSRMLKRVSAHLLKFIDKFPDKSYGALSMLAELVIWPVACEKAESELDACGRIQTSYSSKLSSSYF